MPRRHNKRPRRPAPAFGFNDKDAYENPNNRTIRATRRAGANVARIGVHVDDVDFDRLDNAYNRLSRRGVTPLFALYGMNGDESPRDWNTMMREMARRYRGAAFQIGNEPNLPMFSSGQAQTPEAMARLAKRSERIIHRFQPKATVIAAAPAPVFGRDHYLGYIEELAKLTRGRDIALGVHLYPRGGTNPVARGMADFRAVKRMADGRPVWVTETGFSRANFGEEADNYSAKMYRKLSRGGAQGIIFHTLQPSPHPYGSNYQPWEDGLGALTQEGQPTDTYRSLRRVRRRDLRRRR